MNLHTPDFARNMKLIGHSDIGGRSDGLQLMVHRGLAYLAHTWSQGFSIIDVRDPKNPGEGCPVRGCACNGKGLIYATDYNAGLEIIEYGR